MSEIELEDWAETHYEVSVMVDAASDDPGSGIYEGFGQGNLWQLATSITNYFKEEYKDVVWGEELDYFDTLEEFVNKKLY